MHHCEHDDVFRQLSEIDAVRESSNDRPSRGSVDFRESEWLIQNALEGIVDSRNERQPETRASGLVPTLRLDDILLGLRAEDNWGQAQRVPCSRLRISSQGIAASGFSM